MKKLLLGAVLLLNSFMCIAQETFVKKYTSMVSRKNDVLQPWEKTDVTVVFNPRGVRDIVIYYRNGNKLVLHQISGTTTGTTDAGEDYQMVECINEDGERVTVQLFDDDTCMRIIIAEGFTVEFHKD